VDASSTEGTQVVSEDRFKGLQREFHRQQAEWKNRQAEYEATIESLQAKETSPEMTPTESTAVNDDVLAELQALRAELANQRVETERGKILAEFPEAAPFADLIIGDTPDALRSVAAEIASRVKSLAPATPAPEAAPAEQAPEASTEAPEETPPVAPVSAASASPDTPAGNDPVLEVVAKAVEGGKGGSWEDYFNALNQRHAGQDMELA
jgi:hypothetical protein